jgi:CheY-like chemotaxis protein
MDHIKLLIVDDVEDNRLVLQAVCRKIEGFEIKEAEDGMEAVEISETWHPHIILMDVMMPRLDGFQASKIIKERHPETIIIAVTAVIDPHMEDNMASIGVAAYIHKPIDKELIRFKLQNFAALLRSREGQYKKLSEKEALNPFNSDIRSFKTIFDITGPDAMMDFGMWILARCEAGMLGSCKKVDAAINLFYELMRHGTRNHESLSIIIEESFEEIYVTMKFEETLLLPEKIIPLLNEMGPECIVRGNIACLRLGTYHEEPVSVKKKIPEPESLIIIQEKAPEPEKLVAIVETQATASVPMDEAVSEEAKEVRVLQSNEEQLLRQSFVHKTTAVDYVREIGGDVLDEIRDLESLDAEWKDKLQILEEEATEENLRNFVDMVLSVYVRAINNLFEFTALAYALSSLGSFLKENAEMIVADSKKLKTLIMLMEHLGTDLESWRDHIFGLQDAEDVHYLDSSFFSSCMQIEGIIGDKNISSADDDDGMEFF